MAFGGLKGTLTGNGNSVTNPSDLSGSIAVVIGDLVFVVFAQQTNLTASGVTDNLGNTYTAQNAGTDAGSSTGRAFYSRVTVAGTLTVCHVAATASANDYAGIVGVIEGPFVTSPIDASPANITSDITSPFNCPATGTLAQAQEVVMAWAVSPQGSSNAWAATSPNLLAGQVDNTTLIKAVLGYQVVSATTTVTPVFTCGVNPANDVLGTCSFKASSIFTAVKGDLTLTGKTSAMQSSLKAVNGDLTLAGKTSAMQSSLKAVKGDLLLSGKTISFDFVNRYYVSGGSREWNATDTNNWSTANGGASGASVPTSSEKVIVNANAGADGTIAHVAHTHVSGINGGTSSAIDTSGANFLVVSIAYLSGTSPVLSDSKGNTFIDLDVRDDGTHANIIYFCRNATVGSGHTFTISGTGVLAVGSVGAFSGVNIHFASDDDIGTQNSNPITSIDYGQTLTPSLPNELVIASIAAGSGSSGFAIDSGFTLLDGLDGTTTESGWAAYKIQTTAAAVNPAWSWSVASGAAIKLACFKCKPALTIIGGDSDVCKSLDFTGFTSTLSFDGGSSILDAYGDITLASGMFLDLQNLSYFNFPGGNAVSFTSAGRSLRLGQGGWGLVINNSSALTLADALTGYSIHLRKGTLNLNNFNHAITLLTSLADDGAVTLILGSGTLSVQSFGSASNPSDLTVTPGTSTVKITNAIDFNGATFNTSGKTFNNVWLSFSNNAIINVGGGGTFNDLKVDASQTYKFENSKTFNISTFTDPNSSGAAYIINSDDGATAFSLVGTGGTYSFKGATISNCHASGGTFNASVSDGCVDGGGNSGINFTATTNLTVIKGDLTLTGKIDPIAMAMRVVKGDLTLAGQAAKLLSSLKIVKGDLTLAGQAAKLLSSLKIVKGDLTLAGQPVIPARALLLVKGDLTLTGAAVKITSAYRVVKGDLTLAGKTLTFAIGRVCTVVAGALALAGTTLRLTDALRVVKGDLLFSSVAAGLSTIITVVQGLLSLFGKILSFTNTAPDINVNVTGVQAVGYVADVLVWGTIPDSQTPNWVAIDESQTSDWEPVDDSEDADWTLIPT